MWFILVTDITSGAQQFTRNKMNNIKDGLIKIYQQQFVNSSQPTLEIMKNKKGRALEIFVARSWVVEIIGWHSIFSRNLAKRKIAHQQNAICLLPWWREKRKKKRSLTQPSGRAAGKPSNKDRWRVLDNEAAMRSLKTSVMSEKSF